MRLGLLVEVEEGLTWERWRALFGAAETLGFESIAVSDHLCSPWVAERHGLDAWLALTVAAVETQNVRLGPLVSPVTFRPPAVLARMAESLAALSGGRLTVGIGLGWNREEHVAFGVGFPPVEERARLLEQTAQLLRGTVPVLIGGASERFTLPLVARYADEWNVTTAAVAHYVERSAVLDRLCVDVGRDPASISRSIAVGCLIGRDVADLLARGRRIQEWVPPLASVRVDDVPNAARELGWVVGTPAEIVGQLRSLADAGVQRALLGHYDQVDLDALELIAHEVLPEVM
jgi:alkanesulfonate monooxygenase SsuD/methylene tetrahydromethanopterin reductase-like flavin-dependent oxidoreductase (luciferase family)